MKHSIKAIHAHEILDSRGNPTVQASVLLQDGTVGSASVPSGTSTGSHEAWELRDGDKKRYRGKGVLKAVGNVGKMEKVLRGMSVLQEQEIDAAMVALDGTPNKSRLGANAILAVSLACAHTAARFTHQPLYVYLRSAYALPTTHYVLPFPMMNLLNGGAHANGCMDLQEVMVVPMQKKFAERVRCGAEIFHALRDMLKRKRLPVGVGDEGGYAVPFAKNEEALKTLLLAARTSGYIPGKDVFLAMDVAASEFFKGRKYHLSREGKKVVREDMVKWYKSLVKKYPLVSIEDPLHEDDWAGWVKATHELDSMLVVGDDFFVTNTERLRRGIDMGAANAILIKPNQIGTLTETMAAIGLAKANGYKVIISHRSGETGDTTIADLAVAVNADFIKTGSLSRGERVVKYNRLMEIEEELAAR